MSVSFNKNGIVSVGYPEIENLYTGKPYNAHNVALTYDYETDVFKDYGFDTCTKFAAVENPTYSNYDTKQFMAYSYLMPTSAEADTYYFFTCYVYVSEDCNAPFRIRLESGNVWDKIYKEYEYGNNYIHMRDDTKGKVFRVWGVFKTSSDGVMRLILYPNTNQPNYFSQGYILLAGITVYKGTDIIYPLTSTNQSHGFYTSSHYENTYGMKLKVLDDGSEWARIHWLDVSSTVEWFADANEVAYCVDKSNRYSRMGNVDEFKDVDGVYEFMLTYPSLSDTLYNRWTQTSSPNESSVTGFTEVTTAWSKHNNGIRLSPNINTLYDCDTGNTWHAAIGQLSSWTSTEYIPAANDTSQTSTELWVRLDTLPKQLKVFKNLITANDFIEL